MALPLDTNEESLFMPDNVINELLLETLKAMQGKLSDIASDLHDLKIDMRGMKGHMAKVAQDNAIASLQNRIEHIERHLEISGTSWEAALQGLQDDPE